MPNVYPFRRSFILCVLRQPHPISGRNIEEEEKLVEKIIDKVVHTFTMSIEEYKINNRKQINFN